MNNKFKKIAACSLSVMFALSACSSGSSGLTGTGAEIPKYEIEQKELPDSETLKFASQMKLGWNLGNTLDADTATSVEIASETSWGNPATTEEMILSVKNAGFNTIRIPTTWHNHMDSEYNISGEWMARVKEVVDYAYNNGMYVILNIHHDIAKNYYYPDAEHLETSKAFSDAVWTQVAEEFKDYGERLIFESINEPRQKGTDNEWWINADSDDGREAIDVIVQINQSFVDIVRNSGGNNASRYLMVPSYCANYSFACADAFSMPDDPANRTMLSVHAYDPYSFALDTGGTASFDVNRSSASINDIMDTLYENYTSKGIAVIIGEFGSLNKDNLEDRIEHAAYYVSKAYEAGITCVWWDNNAFTGNGELFGLLDRSTLEWKFPDIVIAMTENCK